MEKLYENIRKIRTVKGLSQENMADELKMSQRHYGRIERGEIDITYSMLCKIAEILNVKPNHLMGMEDMLIFNNYTQHQKGGQLLAYNATDVEKVTNLYERMLKEKEDVIQILKKSIPAIKKNNKK